MTAPRGWRLVLAEVRGLRYRVNDLAKEMGEWTACLKAAAAEPSPAPGGDASPGPGAWLDAVTGRRVVVQVVEGSDVKSLEGLLTLVAADGVILRTAKLLGDGRPTELGGEVWIPRARVLFVQHLADATPQP